MAKLKELTVWMENKPGTLAAMAQALGKARVNILAFMTDEAKGQSRVRLVTDNPAKAGKAVTGLNLRFSEEEVVSVIVANKPGTLAETAGKLETQASISTTATRGQRQVRRNSWSSWP
jgi:hypothetical protein